MTVVFDAHCLLCSGSVCYLLRHDRRRRLRYATVQSDAGRGLLLRAGVGAIDPGSCGLLDGTRTWTGAAAVPRLVPPPPSPARATSPW